MFMFLSKFCYKETVEDLPVLGKTSQHYHFHLSVERHSISFYFFKVLQANFSHVNQSSCVLCFSSKSRTLYTIIRVLYSLSITTHFASFKKRSMFLYTSQMTNNVKICSLNVRGLSDRKKRKDVFAWLQQKHFSIYCLQDIHVDAYAKILNQKYKPGYRTDHSLVFIEIDLLNL